MTDLTDGHFYRRRQEEERGLAERASSAPIRAIHSELAARYAHLAEQVTARTVERAVQMPNPG